MLTLKELGEYYEKGLIRLRVDFCLSPTRKHKGRDGLRINNLEHDQIIRILNCGRFTNHRVSISVSIQIGDVKRNEWEKIKRKLREAGFSYRSESPWFNVYTGGKNGGWGVI
ncbi:MAG: hypothetical protein NTU76_02765 [Candidatus Taylorbacteria bacterium]|nr:hypothetical protein [Candidatus Taylorbacteria bacterium]